MLPVETTYPQFEANQVLSSAHLNDLFEYLDEQNRLTRTNLIGIGIVCGLEVHTAPDSTNITITKGCGVTSQGYLVVMEELVATHFINYEVPEEVPYPLFYDTANDQNKYPMWELKPNASGGATALSSAFLQDKIVLVFVELLEENLKNCSPNSCDDKGAKITAAFRPLLMTKADADAVIKEINDLMGSQTGNDIDQIINAKYYLPEIKLKRYNVPATNIITTQQLVNEYRNILTKTFIESTVRDTLLDAYDAFDLLLDDLDKNIIQNWQVNYGADGKVEMTRAYYYQYVYDFIFDLLETYREIRRKGLEVIGICCPDERLFPRHLFLKEAAHGAAHQRKYRHYFMPSPILTNQKILGEELRQLFERLLSMLENFEIPGPAVSGITKTNPYDNNIRITPSKLGDVFLSEKAIPYYYKVNEGTPPLYEVWNRRLTSSGKAKQNLSYHADQYASEDFILKPLEYDIEPNNFLRIEGHVGKDYLLAVRTITRLKELNRLPFDLVAVKTGNDIEDIQDIREHECYFQDLEAIYLTLKEELECFACKQIRYFYDITSGTRPDNPQSFPTQINSLNNCSANFTYQQGTFGEQFEKIYPQIESGQIPNIITGEPGNTVAYLLVYNLIKIKDSLPASLAQFVTSKFDSFIDYYQKLENAAKALNAIYDQVLNNNDGPSTNLFIRVEDIIDHLDSILEACKKDAFEALKKEYERRLQNLHRQLLFSNYAKKHHGLQHKAGVPIGGTFIIVYHGDYTPPNIIGNIRDVFIANTIQNIFANVTLSENVKNTIVANLEGSIKKNFDTITAKDAENTFVGGTFTNVFNPPGDIVFNPGGGGIFPRPGSFTPRGPSAEDPEVEPGIVIADFYLPYLCCSDCPPVQYILPEVPIETERLAVSQGAPQCSEDNRSFTVACTITGGVPPYTVNGNAIGGTSFTQTFASGQGGEVKVADAAGEETTVTIAAHNCQDPCDKPCGGEAMRCRYLLFMSKPAPNNRILYEFTEVARLTITDENGQVLFGDSLQDIVDEVLSANNHSISNNNFDDKIGSLVKRINDRVAEKFGNTDTFRIEYDPTQGAIISIEHYTCHTFELDIMIGYLQNDINVQVRAIYNQDNVMFEVRVNNQISEQFELPKFGCTQLNKCNDSIKEGCQINVIKDINAEGNREKYSISPSLSPSPGAGAKFFWLMEWGTPMTGTSEKIEGTFITPGFVQARLVVIDAQGCWDYFEKAIQIRN